MQRSLNTGVTAIQNNQIKLDVIANNIANVNTVGFKKSRTLFASTFNDVLRTSALPIGQKGGTNPSVIGLGSKVSSIDTINTQGTLTPTNRTLDVAIKGGGYFTVSDGNNNYYTRSGSLTVSPSDGSLTTSNGLKLMGYLADPTTEQINPNLGLQVIKAPTSDEAIVIPTSDVKFSNNLDKKLAIGDTYTVPFIAIDSLGTQHDLNLEVTITGVGKADWKVSNKEGLVTSNNSGTMTFDTEGHLANTTGGPIQATPIGAEPMDINLDFKQITYLDKVSDFSVKSQNGMTAGVLQDYIINEGGVIQCTYSNGVVKTLGQIPITNFDNPDGLNSIGDSLFTTSNNSGRPLITIDGNSTIMSGYLEASNVDVSEEMTEMIKTQRAYQMGSTVIKTSDEILQQLINIKQ